MDVKQAAEKWGCKASLVRDYCSAGIIPPAEKAGQRGKWTIPDDWPKPPMTRHGLCFLLDTVYQLNAGATYDSVKWGYPIDTVTAGYEYLTGSAFMSAINIKKLESELMKAVVTPRGLDLIQRENDKGKSKIKFTAGIKARATVGFASFQAEGGVSNAG